MSYEAYFDSPSNYKSRFAFYEQGGSPLLLSKFIETIEKQKDEISEINISWYLYNNNILHNYLKYLSNYRIIVNVVTIPLEGYDNTKPQLLEDLYTGKKGNKVVSKYSLAREIFAEIYASRQYKNYNIYFFPHMYVRSAYVNKFSRGSLPYSLHLKCAYIKKKSGYILFLSSSNLAVRDLVKYESMICIQNEAKYEENFSIFYDHLIRNSINIKRYNKEFNTTRNKFESFSFKNKYPSFIIAPFYMNSANELEKSLLDFIYSAKERIIICAQHLAAFNYEFNAKYHSKITTNETRKGILGAILDVASRGIKITCLSQTFATTNEEIKSKGVRFRKPANVNNFQKFFSQLLLTKNSEYFVNERVHSKFIIIDDKLVYCTYNFTPTQFIYLDKVKIPKFINMPDISYEGIHCEVGAHVIIENEPILKLFEENVELLKNKSIKVK